MGISRRAAYGLLLVGAICQGCRAGDAAEHVADAGEAGLPARQDAGEAAVPFLTDAALTQDAWSPAAAVSPRDGFCPQPERTCGAALPESSLAVRLTASDFGEQARFRAVAGASVLVEQADGSGQVVQIEPNWGSTDVATSVQPLPAGERGVGLIDRIDSLLVLSCRTSSGQDCRLWDMRAGSSTPYGGATLPPQLSVRGVFWEYGAFHNVPCVFGDGLWCLRSGAWTAVEQAEAALFESVWSVGGYLVLESADGRWLVNSQSEQPTLQRVEGYAFLHDLPYARESFSLLVGDQLWWWDGLTLQPCQDAPPIVAHVPNQYALASDGSLFAISHGEYKACKALQLPAPGKVIGTSAYMCGISGNSVVLTERYLLAEVGCAVD